MEFDLQRNTGFIAQDPRETDYMVGASLVPLLSNETGDWSAFLPKDEQQVGVYFDTMACVTFSALNSIETQINFLISKGLLSQTHIDFLQNNGYMVNGQVNFSDRYTAKMSGTTSMGNYLVNVWDSIRKDGLVPEKDWSYDPTQRTPVFDWNDYYSPIPQALIDKGRKFLELFDIKYEWLVTGGTATLKQYKEWLKGAPIQLAVGTCPTWNTGNVVACDKNMNHAILLHNVTDLYHIFDHYTPFRKTLASDYRVPYALRGVITTKSSIPPAVYDPTFAKKYDGKMILAVEDNGSLWYVTDTKRVKIGRKPEEVDEFLRLVNEKKVPVTGMKNSDIAKIEVIK